VILENMLNINEIILQVVDWDIMRKAKSYFIKCNRILYKCLHPGTSKYKMRGILSAAWNTLPSSEKQIYVLQVTFILNCYEVI
jgi:hypothetical protein